MSQVIYYDKLMLRILDGKYLPLVLLGFTIRPSEFKRNYASWNINDLLVERRNPVSTEGEMMSHLHDIIDNYSPKDVGRLMETDLRWVHKPLISRKQFENMVILGVRRAIDIEKLLEFGVDLSLNNTPINTKDEFLCKYTELRILGCPMWVELYNMNSERLKQLRRRINGSDKYQEIIRDWK